MFICRSVLFFSYVTMVFYSAFTYICAHVRQLKQQTIKYSNEFFFLFSAIDRHDWLEFVGYVPIETHAIANGIALVENEREKSFFFLCCVLLRQALVCIPDPTTIIIKAETKNDRKRRERERERGGANERKKEAYAYRERKSA